MIVLERRHCTITNRLHEAKKNYFLFLFSVKCLAEINAGALCAVHIERREIWEWRPTAEKVYRKICTHANVSRDKFLSSKCANVQKKTKINRKREKIWVYLDYKEWVGCLLNVVLKRNFKMPGVSLLKMKYEVFNLIHQNPGKIFFYFMNFTVWLKSYIQFSESFHKILNLNFLKNSPIFQLFRKDSKKLFRSPELNFLDLKFS